MHLYKKEKNAKGIAPLNSFSAGSLGRNHQFWRAGHTVVVNDL